jgi:hypothetical protein
MILVKEVEDWDALTEREPWERVSRVEAESTVALVSAHEEAESLVWNIALLEGELVEAHRARGVSEENSCALSDMAANAERWWDVSEREHREQFEELTILQTWGSKLCLAIIGPPWLRNHMLERMWVAILCHTEMVGELVALWAVVSSTMEFTLGCSPDETLQVEVVGELVAKFQKVEEQHSRLEQPGMRICDLLVWPPTGQAWMGIHLDEVAGQLRVERATW